MRIVAPLKFQDTTPQSSARIPLAELDVTSANVLVTAAQASADHINIIGTPSVARTVTMPDVVYGAAIYNATSQIITVKRALTTGFSLAAGATAHITYNGS